MGNLSTGAIAGVSIAAVAFIILCITGIIYLSRHQSAARHAQSLHIQRERNTNKTVRDRAGTLVHGDEENGNAGGTGEREGVNGNARPKIGGMRIGESYYHEMEHDKVMAQVGR
jgi:hypothetical protein